MSIGYLDKLMFTVGMSDMFSKPALSINNTINGMKKNASSGFESIRGGAFGLAGAGIAIKTFMQPVYDINKSLGEVKSLGVINSELQALKKSSLAFSMQYGESASDFVSSSYDIQSAISGLAKGDLATFTYSSNVLAKGTKADADTITNYMGTMYGIFQANANAMGKSKWVEQLTGQTALAVKMFKTDGTQMSAAFTSIGADATANGVAINEQMAILGTLQATMSGSEAGTKYKQFLAGAAGAQEKLGLSFTDNQGRLLPMLEILDKLKGKFGNTFDAAEGLALKQAFGSQESVSLIKLLIGQTDGLATSINKLGKVTGMKDAESMAKAMVDPWEQFTAVTEAVRISFGTSLMPTVNEFLKMLSSGLQKLTVWTEAFPNITRYVGLLALGILGMSAATGLFSIMLGLGQTAMAAWGAVVLVFKGLMIGLNIVLGALRAGFMLLSIAMYANPIGLIVLAVIGLIVGIALLTNWWGKLYKMFADTSFGAFIIEWIGNTWDRFTNLFNMLIKSWKFISDFFSELNFGQAIYDFLDKVITGFNKISGFLGFDGEAEIKSTNSEVTKIEGLNNSRTAVENNDGIAKQIANAISSNSGNLFGDVTINAEGGMSPEHLENWGALQGG